jgi:hypothetical protein
LVSAISVAQQVELAYYLGVGEWEEGLAPQAVEELVLVVAP